jgi:transposase
VAAVRRVRQQFGQRGTLEPRTHRCGRKTLLTEARKQRLRELLSEQPDATLVHRSINALYYPSGAVGVCVWADARLGIAGLLR